MSGTGMISGLVGARVKRREDMRILTGQGRYIDDVGEPGMLACGFVRSLVPHGRILRVDAEAARTADGVVAVFTGAELAELTNPITVQAPMPGLTCPSYLALAVDRVRHVGEPVAMVVAENRYLAEDAAALVDVEYEELPAVVDATQAVAEGAPQLFDDVPGNIVYTHGRVVGDVEEAFASADYVVADRLDQHRWSCVPMEGRGGVATYDASTGALTYEASTQTTHFLRVLLAGLVKHPVSQFRVIANDIGGGFGLKFAMAREDIAVCAAAKRLGASVKWVEDRQENLIASGAARDESMEVEAAVRADGMILGLRGRLLMNQGAYPIMPPCAITANTIGVLLPGPYRVPAYEFSATIACTNKAPYIALRGPWAVETLMRERLLDKIAGQLGLTPIEIRRRNLITLEEQPAPMGSAVPLNGVTAAETFERLSSTIDSGEIRAERNRARARGRLAGFGVATAIEPAPGTPEFSEKVGFPFQSEPTRVRVEPDGRVTAFTPQVPHGQGHETTLSQVIADEMGVAFDDVRIVFGDTDATPFSMIGTAGSKAATMATGGVTVAVREVKRRILGIAAHLLEASPDDLEIFNSIVSVRGDPDAGIPLAQIAMGCYMAPAMMPPGTDPNLEVVGVYDGEGGGWSQATHACWVEVDPETGKIEIKRYRVVEDCGTLINPGIVDGQVFGAVAMGLGGMLLEHSAYGPDGQYLAATFMDYLMPSAPEVPEIEIEHLQFESPTMIGSRGVGEGGTVLAPAALLNAVDDALGQAGAQRITATPLTPTRILEALGVIPPQAG